MKKENTNEKFTRAINDNLMNIIFEKPIDTANTPEEQLLKHKRSFGLKVQSVALPKEHELFTLKTEGQVMNWMENKIHNVHTAYHKIHNKFDVENEMVHWSNNKMQNERFLETKNLYKCRAEY
jgi:hypothetical protein